MLFSDTIVTSTTENSTITHECECRCKIYSMIRRSDLVFWAIFLLVAKGAGNPGWISDGFCDDVNNNLDCLYDGGDCCGFNVRKQYCLTCQCLGKYKPLKN